MPGGGLRAVWPVDEGAIMAVGSLVLRREVGQSVRIGDVWVRVAKVRGKGAVLQIVANQEVAILRHELVPECDRPAWLSSNVSRTQGEGDDRA